MSSLIPIDLLAGRRILVVEDEVLVAMELSFALADAGASVAGPAHTIRDAAALAAAGGIDAAVLDVDLHGREIFPIAALLAEAGVPFVFHTGHASRGQIPGPFADVRVFTKPTPPETLVLEISLLLG